MQAAKKRETEVRREQKAKEKEQVARQKALEKEFAAVNVLKRDKRTTCAEMIVDIDTEFSLTDAGEQLVRVLKELGTEVSTNWQSPAGNMIKWRRKVKAEYNASLDQFVPISEEIRKEKFILIVLTGVEFVNMVLEDELAEKIEMVQCLFPEMKLIYMIEGLSSFLQKILKENRREFEKLAQNALLEAEGQTGTTKSRARKRKESDFYSRIFAKYNAAVDDERVEDALIALQVHYNCLVCHSASPVDSATWISILTQDIGTIPYKRARTNIHETICMEAGQIQAGKSVEDTFRRTIRQVKYVTDPLAGGIVQRHGTLSKMMESVQTAGHDAFLDVDRASSGPRMRRLGQKLAADLHFIFSCTDPEALLNQT